mgnify:CR=1 FL=1
MKGNEAIAEAAIRGGCRYFFGYPITPQTEIPEYLSWRLFEVGGDFVQAESEVAAINMVYGAGGAGGRAMTSSSSPGISLKQEGISYMACSEIPAVVVNMVRAGPGLGGIQPSQADYSQAVKGGGHGDYRLLVYAPATIQEAVDIMYIAWDKAEKYRIPVFILGDGMMGQLMEPVELPPLKEMGSPERHSWATTGTHYGEDRRIINSLYLLSEENERQNFKLQAKYREIEKNEVICETVSVDDAEIVLTAYGSIGRICKSALAMLREKGVKAGLIRPTTLFPFPTETFKKVAAMPNVKRFLTVELSAGQYNEDVRLSVNGAKPVSLFYRLGGEVMSPEDIVEKVMEVIE